MRLRMPTPGPVAAAHPPSALALQVLVTLQRRDGRRDGDGEGAPAARFPPHTHPTPCERRGALHSAHPSHLFEHARLFNIPGPNPPTKALLARLVHRRAIFFVERGLGLALCMCLAVS